MMKYVVSVEYCKFIFDDAESAMQFATTAMMHSDGTKSRKEKVEVRIELKYAEKENAKEEEE